MIDAETQVLKEVIPKILSNASNCTTTDKVSAGSDWARLGIQTAIFAVIWQIYLLLIQINEILIKK